jgi:NNP family nitrate/nitrite transporter-like MFS transporter
VRIKKKEPAVNFKDFKKAGHWPTLLAAFLYFDFSFMVWVTLGPLIIYISRDLQLAMEDKFTLVAIPILAGALLRIPLGTLADYIGPKRTGILGQLIVIGAVAAVWLFGLHNKLQVELLGVALGVAGASFAVALPQASRWYPPHYQGIVMGIAGAGNMGVVLDTLIIPSVAETHGWQAAFGFLLIPLVAVLVIYALIARDAPNARQPLTLSAYRGLLKDKDSWWFMFFYFITFGGFVGLGNALPLYFTVQYHASGVAAGILVAIIVAFGSAFRPVGGHIADRIGGIRTLSVLFAIVSAAYFLISLLPEGPAPGGALGGEKYWGFFELPAIAWLAALLFCGGALALGMGNGAVFQLVPQRFRKEIGGMTGMIGCAGGIGGFFLAKALGVSQGMTGGFGSGFIFFGVLAMLGLFGLVSVRRRWRTTWGAASGARI